MVAVNWLDPDSSHPPAASSPPAERGRPPGTGNRLRSAMSALWTSLGMLAGISGPAWLVTDGIGAPEPEDPPDS